MIYSDMSLLRLALTHFESISFLATVDGSCDSARGLTVLTKAQDRPHSQKHFLTPLPAAEKRKYRKYLRLFFFFLKSRLTKCFTKNSMNVISRAAQAAGNSHTHHSQTAVR